jgi:ubiquinone/menaquinone biosynthesis C-methylase UbiE
MITKQKRPWPQGQALHRLADIQPYLQRADKILDIGSGNCILAKELLDSGYNLTPLDVVDKSRVPEIKPLIYDGKRLPFADNSFDVALLITVLHHTPDPELILREACRVASRIMIVEDLHDSIFQKYLTFAMDSTLNLEFFGHPHSNKNAEEWRQTFGELGLEVIEEHSHPFWRFFKSGTFYLKRK